MDSIETNEILQDFIVESKEALETIEPQVINLGTAIDESQIAEAIDDIFRLFHSLKGGAGFLGLLRIEKAAHTSENLLQHFRNNVSLLEPEHVDSLAAACDLLSAFLAQVEESGTDSGSEEKFEKVVSDIEGQTQKIEGFAEAKYLVPDSLLHDIESSFKSLRELIPTNFHDSPQWQAVEAVITKVQEYRDTSDDTENPPSETSPDQPAINYNRDIANDAFNKFISEGLEYLDAAEGALLVLFQLGEEIDSREYIETILRNFHNLKGNASIVGVQAIENTAHWVESFLSPLQEKGASLTEDQIQSLLQAVDALREALNGLSHAAEGQTVDWDSIQSRVQSLLSVGGNTKSLGDIMKEMGIVDEIAIQKAVERQQAPIGEILVEMGEVTPEEVDRALEHQRAADEGDELKSQTADTQPSEKAEATKKAAVRAEIRVGLDKVERMINLSGELVIIESMLSNAVSKRGDRGLVTTVGQLAKNVREMQEVSMSMRMVPVSTAFRRMVRVVHDVARKSGKQVHLETDGENTELDKTLVEQITDPLLHIIRNAVDHGLEPPEERTELGKPQRGLINLSAKHAGNEVFIEISDDGRGLAREKILKRAIERQIISENTQLSDSEVFQLIFEPGFSTAEKVTEVSGRGVGMDIVRRNIEKLHGRIDIRSTPGKGSQFSLRIPLTLTIVEGLLVRVGGSQYAVPVEAVREALHPSKKELGTAFGGDELLRLRGEELPVLRLHAIHQLTPDQHDLTKGTLVILEEDGKRAGLFVDEVLGMQQLVVKALPKAVGNLPHLGGCTILGDGGMGLILDLSQLMSRLT